MKALSKKVFNVFVVFAFFIAAFYFISGDKTSDLATIEYTEEVSSYEARAYVPSPEEFTSIGVSRDPDLNFGTIPVNTNVTKTIIVGNSKDFKVTVFINSTGNISGFLELSANEFLLNPDGTARVRVTFSAVNPGNYTGKLTVYARYILGE